MVTSNDNRAGVVSLGSKRLRLGTAIESTTEALTVRSVPSGLQPDGDYVDARSSGMAFSTSTPLAGDATYTSAWVDSDGWSTIELYVASDVPGATDGIHIDFTSDTSAGTPTVDATLDYTFNSNDVREGYEVIRVPTVLDGFRVRYTNGSSAQSSFKIVATLRTDMNNFRYNKARALIVADFGTEVALDLVSNYGYILKFGRNPDIDAGPEDVWGYGGTYTGFPNAFTPETVDISSSDTNDTSAGTGARTVRISGLKSSTSTAYETEDLTLNGTTKVTSSNTWWRVNRAYVLTAGSGGTNAGNITVQSTTTTANIFAYIIAGEAQTQMAVYTVPHDRRIILKTGYVSIVRASGTAGSAVCTVRAREPGGVFRAVHNVDLQTGGAPSFNFVGGLVLPEGTDIKVTIDSVSDPNTFATASFEAYILTIQPE